MADTPGSPKRNLSTEPLPFDERTRRVLELRRLVREGLYRPDPHEVAAAMLREWLDTSASTLKELRPAVETARDRSVAAAALFVVERGTEEAPASEQIA